MSLSFGSKSFAADVSCAAQCPFPMKNIPDLSAGTLSDEDIVTATDNQFCPQHRAVTAAVNPNQLPDNGSVWRVGSNRWDEKNEKAFSEFVEKEVDIDFFRRFNIPTDCADAAVSLRVIFARIHHLPISIEGDKGELNFSTRKYAKLKTVKDWDASNWKQALLKDERFRTYLFDIHAQVAAENLSKNTFPVRLTDCKKPGAKPTMSSLINPGTVVLDKHHTRFIAKVDTTDKSEPIQTVSSTVPREVRTLFAGAIEMGYGGGKTYGLGILHFNWAVNCGGAFGQVPDQKMPGFSTEQYGDLGNSKDQADYLKAIAPGKRGLPDKRYVERKLKQLKQRFVARLEVVEKAQAKLKQDPKVFRNPAAQDDYSTPLLDALLYGEISALLYAKTDPDAKLFYENRLRHTVIVLGGGRSMTYEEFMRAYESKMVSSNPDTKPEDRWGWAYLDVKMKSLKAVNASAKKDLERSIQNLSSVERVKYNLGKLKLAEEETLKRTSAEIADLKTRGVTD